MVYDVAEQKGYQFEGIEDGQQLVKIASEYWREVDGIKTASKSEVRDLLEREL